MNIRMLAMLLSMVIILHSDLQQQITTIIYEHLKINIIEITK